MMRINFNLLDSLRGIAAFYVCVNHSRGNLFQGINNLISYHPMSEWSLWEKLYYSMLQLTILGHEFVIVFFILSGFSIAFSVLRGGDVKDFYLRRLIRLYPPYLTGIFWAYLTYILIMYFVPSWLNCESGTITALLLCKVNMLEPLVFIKNLFYVNTGFILSPYWSLVYEVIFYALIPFMILKRNIYLLGSLALFILHFVLNGISYNHDNVMLSYFLHYNFYFAIGVFTYIYRDLIFKKTKLNLFMEVLLILVMFILTVGLKLLLGGDQVVSELSSVIMSIILMRCFLVYELHIPLLEYLGKISYTLYVTHFATLFFIKLVANQIFGYDGSFIKNPYIWMIGPVICVLVAHVFYKLTEEPSKKLLEKLRKKVKAVA